MQSSKQRLYFPGLNALRFIAASLVVISHVEVLKNYSGLTAEIPYTGLLREQTGRYAVVFFFVLSGYLITYLLLVERERFGTINVPRFYLRRVLRIWPLYYAAILIGVVILLPLLPPQHIAAELNRHFARSLALYLGFVPNLASAFRLDIAYLDHLWSIGTEEQFYLIWPLLVAWARGHRVFWVLVAIVVLFAVGQVACLELSVRGLLSPGTNEVVQQVRTVILNIPLSCMGIGGLGAYLLFYHPVWAQRLVARPWVELLVVATILWFMVYQRPFYGFNTEVFASFFCYLILSISTAKKSFLRLEGPRWTHLGNISYGIYATHWVVLVGLAWCLTRAGIRTNGWVANSCLYGLCLPLSVALASVSYRYFESYFIQLKERFQLVKSGSPTTDSAEPPAAPPTPATA